MRAMPSDTADSSGFYARNAVVMVSSCVLDWCEVKAPMARVLQDLPDREVLREQLHRAEPHVPGRAGVCVQRRGGAVSDEVEPIQESGEPEEDIQEPDDQSPGFGSWGADHRRTGLHPG